MSIKVESPLNQIDLSSLAASESLQVTELPFRGYVIVRGSSSHAAFTGACASVLGAELPTEANTKVEAEKGEVLWYGPDEWLIVTPDHAVEALIAELQSALTDVHSSVVDISGGNTMIEVAGPQARALLAKGTPFDLHASVFQLGQCAQTVLAKTAATIYPVTDGNAFRVIFRRSFADYLGVWLLDAAREFVQD